MSVHTVWTKKRKRTGESFLMTSASTPSDPGGDSGADSGADPAVDPVAALRRIAFLLERRLADSYRIKAYRGAAAALLSLPAEEVRSRSHAGTLRDLPGIGAKTAGIVAECVAGDVPGYLTELEQTAGPL